ncbi:MAG: response regulator transcription factor [Planctomycetes bacterium]|nr:response regulator transcription factor [Planctomycetota bacterium]
MPHKVLIIEDDRSLVEILTYNLRQAGYETYAAFDGMDGLSQAQLKSPDIVVLDIMLPIMDGLEVCRRLRSSPATSDVLILMLTAKAEESDELVGFSLGADDYVSKPYSVKLLIERIKALQRRRRGNGELRDPDIVTLGGLTVDRRRFQAHLGDELLTLTRSEFRLLDTLIRQPGRAFQRSELINAALGEDTIVLERTIDVHIRSVRRKLGEAADLIETVRGVGYRFRDRQSD